MKKSTIAIILSACLGLTACATAPNPRSPTVVDSEYIAHVEAHARHAGVDVYWVNPPRRERRGEEQN